MSAPCHFVATRPSTPCEELSTILPTAVSLASRTTYPLPKPLTPPVPCQLVLAFSSGWCVKHSFSGRVDDYGVRRELPLSSSLGWYTFPFFSRLDENDVLDQCGPGIVLYFKLLKALALMFLVMSAMTTPSLILYAINNVAEPVEKAYTKDLKSLQVLTYTTLGALGEPVPSCRRVSEGTEFSFRCPAGGTIRSIVAYYGQPYGSCTCPGYQQPKEVGTCYGIRTGGLQQQLLSDRLNFKGQSCLPDSSGQVYPCFLGSTRYENECCSLTLDAEGYPDLSALEIKINGACNSYTLPYIVNATCLGQSSCSFNVSVRSIIFFLLPLNPFSRSTGASSFRSAAFRPSHWLQMYAKVLQDPHA